MIIPVTSSGKLLVESGVFNSPFLANNETEINFNYNGLKIKLILHVYIDVPGAITPTTLPDFNATIENGTVVMKQFYYFKEPQTPSWGYSGMLIPLEVGVKPDGKKIYMSWKTDVARSFGGTLMAVTHYSFYEDE
ncbi:hypothetical protein [Enterobacter roggenkampii]|uniref:hypothetical protein n=1 Tax=Enterobacter roggenkampii TaxID=1812935 RepID=UPI00200338BA|nr:hypothetical protein [Enterobacter roggenkampii]MCK7012270.1 hypothetical protein [Enterobacter roggenkampii]MCK7026152.1 hypothetical protein [Enterobacter roggenkampii]MCK7053820.1 hypothetical protein [Enterobacter roggenkampii]HCM9478718.1 hypothetical protein [Enterobacter roggenkampii]HCM9670767.1 hypothetical protein [Enterobacter roggenkampii]